MREQNTKKGGESINKTEIRNLLGKGLKVIVIMMIDELRRRMDKHTEILNKEIKNIRKFQTEIIQR